MARNEKSVTRHTWRWPSVTLALMTVMAAAVIASEGRGYYLLPTLSRRADHLHSLLRPSGTLGHPLGAIGLLLIGSNLAYLVRRRFAAKAGLGSMRAWLRWHVVSGVAGPVMVLLHSAFTLRSAPATVASGALLVVVLSGLVGRYLYGLVPRARDGSARDLQDLAAEVDRAAMELRTLGPAGTSAAEVLDAATTHSGSAVARVGGLRDDLRALAAAFGLRRRVRHALATVDRSLAAEPTERSRAARSTAHRLADNVVRIEALGLLQRAASAWRTLHRDLALLMLVATSLHVAVAVYLGYGFFQ